MEHTLSGKLVSSIVSEEPESVCRAILDVAGGMDWDISGNSREISGSVGSASSGGVSQTSVCDEENIPLWEFSKSIHPPRITTSESAPKAVRTSDVRTVPRGMVEKLIL